MTSPTSTRRLVLEDGNLYMETTTGSADPPTTKSPFRLLAGSMHYFRIPRAYYRDRIMKCRQMGCNTVETYIAWNYHQPENNDHWVHLDDLVEFVECVRDAGLFMIVRMSPYICAEWENGGLPYWLLTDRNVRLRSRHPIFMKAVYEFYTVMVRTLQPYFSTTNNGHIIACQLENEYGCTQTDAEYLRLQYEYLRNDLDVDLPIFNGVWPEERFLRNCHLPGCIATVNFSEHAAKNFATLERSMADIQPAVKPVRLCTELWIGWFTAWGGQRYKPKEPAAVIAERLDDVLANGGHAILYMFHGGTNFAFFNGSNIRTDYCSWTITSYDYEAPLNEAGQVTELYTQCQAVVAKHGFVPDQRHYGHDDQTFVPVPPPVEYESIVVTESANVLDQLDQITADHNRKIVSPYPLTMEECHQGYGYLVYRTHIPGPTPPDVVEAGGETISINELRDRAHVYLNGDYFETMERTGGRGVIVSNKKLIVPATAKSAELTLMIENQGRANFAPYTQEYKGITESVFCGGCLCLSNWEHYCLPWTKDQLERVQWSALTTTTDAMDIQRRPALFRAKWDLTSHTTTPLRDTYIRLPSPWQKGVVFVNGFNLGRYWNTRGPQQSLYCPATVLVPGAVNEIIILEEEQAGTTIEFVDHLIIVEEQLKVVEMPQDSTG